MCNFFSFVTEPVNHGGQRFYFDFKARKNYFDQTVCDSHSTICEHFGLSEDKCNKYEYDFSNHELKIDQINSEVDDIASVSEWVEKLELSKIVDFESMGISVGKVFIFKPLDEVEKLHRAKKIEAGWNRDMNRFCDERKEIPLDSLDTILRIYTHCYLIDGWAITFSMLDEKKETPD